MSVPQITPVDKESAAAERNAEILDVAVSAFATQGYAETDVQEIADRVGVGKGTVYRHFGNKEALFLAAVKHARGKLIAAVDAAQGDDGEPLGQLRRCMTSIIQFFDAHPEIVELVIKERALFQDRRPSLFFEYDEDRRRQWAERLEKLIAAGQLRDMPVGQIQDALSSFVFGAMFYSYFEGNRKPMAEQSAALFDILFNGLLAK